MKLLMIPIGPSFDLSIDVACKEQKYLQVTICSILPSVSNSLAERNVVGEKVSFPAALPLISSDLDWAWLSHLRNRSDRMIHLTRSWSSKLSSRPLSRQRCRSEAGVSEVSRIESKACLSMTDCLLESVDARKIEH